MEVPLKLRQTLKVIVEVLEEVPQVLHSHWRLPTHRQQNRNPRHGKFSIVCIICWTPRYGLNNSLLYLSMAISMCNKKLCSCDMVQLVRAIQLKILISTPVYFI